MLNAKVTMEYYGVVEAVWMKYLTIKKREESIFVKLFLALTQEATNFDNRFRKIRKVKNLNQLTNKTTR